MQLLHGMAPGSDEEDIAQRGIRYMFSLKGAIYMCCMAINGRLLGL